MRCAIKFLALVSMSVIGACGGDDPVAPQEPATVDIDFQVEHWILDDPTFDRESVWIYRREAVGNYPIDFTWEQRQVARTGLTSTGDVVISISVQCEYDGTLPHCFLTFEGNCTEEAGANQQCTWSPFELGELVCTEGVVRISEFQTHDCVPPA
jgi:hypothetical protein